MSKRVHVFAVGLAFASAGCFGVSSTRADEIKLLSSGALHEICDEALPAFEKASSHTVKVTFAGTVDIKKKIAAGEVYDLVIVGAPEVEAFIKGGKMKEGSRVNIAGSGVGVAVKAGAPKPDVGSAGGLKTALLKAKAVVLSTGPSGVYVLKMFEKLGVADELKSKSKQTVPGSRVGQYLARGEADLGFQQISELIHEQGIDYIGPLPPELQNVTLFSSGIGSGAASPAAAKALQAFMTSSDAAGIIKKNGMEPSAR